jgi:hypothetical protein
MEDRSQEIAVRHHFIGVVWHVQLGHGGGLKTARCKPATGFPQELTRGVGSKSPSPCK